MPGGTGECQAFRPSAASNAGTGDEKIIYVTCLAVTPYSLVSRYQHEVFISFWSCRSGWKKWVSEDSNGQLEWKEKRVITNLLQETGHISTSPSLALIGQLPHPRLISSPHFHINSNFLNLTHSFPEDGDSVFLRNANTNQLDHTALKPRRRLQYESCPLQIRQIETIV